MKVICAFDELTNFAHTPLVQIHAALANSKVFLKYAVSWEWLLLYPLSLNFALTNLLKATFLGMSLPD